MLRTTRMKLKESTRRNEPDRNDRNGMCATLQVLIISDPMWRTCRPRAAHVHFIKLFGRAQPKMTQFWRKRYGPVRANAWPELGQLCPKLAKLFSKSAEFVRVLPEFGKIWATSEEGCGFRVQFGQIRPNLTALGKVGQNCRRVGPYRQICMSKVGAWVHGWSSVGLRGRAGWGCGGGAGWGRGGVRGAVANEWKGWSNPSRTQVEPNSKLVRTYPSGSRRAPSLAEPNPTQILSNQGHIWSKHTKASSSPTHTWLAPPPKMPEPCHRGPESKQRLAGPSTMSLEPKPVLLESNSPNSVDKCSAPRWRAHLGGLQWRPYETHPRST